jgi:hypothetical protein
MVTWITPSGFLFTATELSTTTSSVSASGAGVAYSLISGNLPQGLRLSSTGTITGIPDAVIKTERSKFVVRAKNSTSAVDRTFSIDVSGKTDPTWLTTAGYIPVGYFGRKFLTNLEHVDFQFSATTTQSPTGTNLRYYIADGEGSLPKGLQLDQTGRLFGTVNDQVTFDNNQADNGGYDEEFYDRYSYDHSITTSTDVTPNTPRFYKFYVTATDGVASSKREFKILVVNSNVFGVDDVSISINSSSTIFPSEIINTASISSLQSPQFINGADLGTVRAGNNQDISVTAYDPAPFKGPVTYSITGTNTVFTRIPQGLKLDSKTGTLYGYIPYQPAYSLDYALTIIATKTETRTGETAQAVNTFTLRVAGDVDSEIAWISSSTLDTLVVGETSELAVKAQHLKTDYNIKYSLVNGSLPSGITFRQDGGLSGSADYNTTGSYQFTVMASDVYNLSSISKTFNLEVVPYDFKEYTKIYARPFVSLAKRNEYKEFINNEFTFDPKFMYRYFDPNFGVQPEVRMYLEFGIEKLNFTEYIPALQENFYRKKLYFGDIKIAVAKDSTGASIYEVVYVDMIDPLINANGDSVDAVIYDNNQILYPNSVSNMRKQLEQIVLPDNTYISTNEYNMPRYMRTPQQGDYRPPGYMRVVPLCYALPGYGAKIVSRIKLSGFDFKMINFDIDRLILENSLDSASAKYLIFARQTISDRIPEDDILFGPDEVTLQTEAGNPISRIIP